MTPVRAPEGPLETFAKTAAADARQGRYEARETLRAFASRKRVRACGRDVLGNSDLVLRVSQGPDGSAAAGWLGFEHCASVWACPVCSAKIAAHRQAELARAVELHEASGGGLAMLTVTIRHRKGHGLAELWDAVSGAWRKLVSSRAYKDLTVRAGMVGYVRATEVTHGSNGWHVHLHVLYFLAAPLGKDTSCSLRNALSARWVASVAAVGFSADDKAQDFKVFLGHGEALLAAAAYVVKTTYTPSSAAAELTRADYKTGRRGSRTPFEIARQLTEQLRDTGEINGPDLALWQEWERESTGRRQLVWSRGLRELLGMDDELSDAEILDLVPEGFDVLKVEGDDKRRLGRDATTLAVCLTIAERAAAGSSGTWLDARTEVGLYLTLQGYSWGAVHVR